MTTKLALVTGGNRGIGLEICRSLLQLQLPSPTTTATTTVHVLLGCRDESAGKKAVDELSSSVPGASARVTAVPCDVESEASVAALAESVDAKARQLGLPGLSILVNNAGFAFKGSRFSADDAATTIGINVHGTMRVTRAMLPSLERTARAANGALGAARIVNIASQAGYLGQLPSQALRDAFASPDATHASIDALLSQFVVDIRDGKHKERGWSNTMYGVSKLGLIAHTNVLTRELAPAGIAVYAVCPGWCATDMSSWKGPRSASQGADTPVWLATRSLDGLDSSDRNGGFWYDRKRIVW